MARSHLWPTSGFDLGVSAVDLGRRRTTSVTGVHLWCMKTTTENVSATTADHDDNVIHGAFEASYSVKDLADELHVSAQTIYDLRTQGRGPVGFRVGRCLRFRRSEIDAWLARLEEEDAQRQGGGA